MHENLKKNVEEFPLIDVKAQVRVLKSFVFEQHYKNPDFNLDSEQGLVNQL